MATLLLSTLLLSIIIADDAVILILLQGGSGRRGLVKDVPEVSARPRSQIQLLLTLNPILSTTLLPASLQGGKPCSPYLSQAPGKANSYN